MVAVNLYPPLAASTSVKIYTTQEIKSLLAVENSEFVNKEVIPQTEVAQVPMSEPECPPNNIDGLSPMVTPKVADAVVDAADYEIARSGMQKLTQPGQAFDWAASRFSGAHAGLPVPVYSYIYHSQCYTEWKLAYYTVPYYSGTNRYVGDVKVTTDYKATVLSVAIPNAAAMASGNMSEFLTYDKVKNMFPEAQIVAVWEENDVMGYPAEFFWKVLLDDSTETNLTPFGDEMIYNPLNGKLYRKNVNLRLPSRDIPVFPDGYNLRQNYPNPFNATTQISFSLPEAAQVKLEIYNVLGQKVKILVDQFMEAGNKRVTWDGTNASGEKVSSGIYFSRFQAGNHIDSRKLHFLK